MNAESLDRIFQFLEVKKVKKYETYYAITCIMSPWTHPSGKDRKPSALISITDTNKSWYNCLSCGISEPLINVLYALRDHTGEKYTELVEEVDKEEKEVFIHALNSFTDRKWYFSPQDPINDLRTPEEEKFKESELENFKNKVPAYALKRGIPIEICKYFELGYDQTKGEERLVFPVKDFENNLVGITGRAINNQIINKYKDYMGFKKSHFLYGEVLWNNEPELKSKPVCLVEGPIDSIKLYMACKDKVWPLACFGSKVSKKQASKISFFSDNRLIYTLFDSDYAGQDAREQVDKHLTSTHPVIHIELPAGVKDPAECTTEQLQNLF